MFVAKRGGPSYGQPQSPRRDGNSSGSVPTQGPPPRRRPNSAAEAERLWCIFGPLSFSIALSHPLFSSFFFPFIPSLPHPPFGRFLALLRIGRRCVRSTQQVPAMPWMSRAERRQRRPGVRPRQNHRQADPFSLVIFPFDSPPSFLFSSACLFSLFALLPGGGGGGGGGGGCPPLFSPSVVRPLPKVKTQQTIFVATTAGTRSP